MIDWLMCLIYDWLSNGIKYKFKWSMGLKYGWLINGFNVWMTDQWNEYIIDWSMDWI